MRIDVHNHFYPQAYLDEVARLGGVVRLEEEGHFRIYTKPGDWYRPAEVYGQACELLFQYDSL